MAEQLKQFKVGVVDTVETKTTLPIVENSPTTSAVVKYFTAKNISNTPITLEVTKGNTTVAEAVLGKDESLKLTEPDYIEKNTTLNMVHAKKPSFVVDILYVERGVYAFYDAYTGGYLIIRENVNNDNRVHITKISSAGSILSDKVVYFRGSTTALYTTAANTSYQTSATGKVLSNGFLALAWYGRTTSNTSSWYDFEMLIDPDTGEMIASQNNNGNYRLIEEIVSSDGEVGAVFVPNGSYYVYYGFTNFSSGLGIRYIYASVSYYNSTAVGFDNNTKKLYVFDGNNSTTSAHLRVYDFSNTSSSNTGHITPPESYQTIYTTLQVNSVGSNILVIKGTHLAIEYRYSSATPYKAVVEIYSTSSLSRVSSASVVQDDTNYNYSSRFLEGYSATGAFTFLMTPPFMKIPCNFDETTNTTTIDMASAVKSTDTMACVQGNTNSDVAYLLSNVTKFKTDVGFVEATSKLTVDVWGVEIN